MNEPKPAPAQSDRACTFQSLDSVILFFDAKGDNTPQPRPAYVPRDWPPQARRSSSEQVPPAPERVGRSLRKLNAGLRCLSFCRPRDRQQAQGMAAARPHLSGR